MSEVSVSNSNTRNQFDVFKLSEKGFNVEQINEIFELDHYFAEHGIGEKGDLIKLFSTNDDILFHNSLERNIKVVLKYQDNPVFNRIAERLRCSSVEDYYKYILSVRELESFCNTYTSSKNSEKSLDYPRDENGNVILEPKDYLITNIPSTKGSRAGKWYLLSNRTRVFIKNICSEREAYSELVSEEIAKQMKMPYARYDLVQMGGLRKIASINILETGEELLHGSDILTVPRIKDIGIICSNINNKLKRDYPDVSEEEKQKIKEDFLKLTIFDKVISNWDRNPDNWGFVISPNGKIKLAPEFDNNKALELKTFDYNKAMHLGDDYSVDGLLDYCMNNFSDENEFLEFVDNCVKNVSVRKACNSIQNEKNISIPHSEMMDMEMVVEGRATQNMRRWLDKTKRKRTPVKEEEPTK